MPHPQALDRASRRRAVADHRRPRAGRGGLIALAAGGMAAAAVANTLLARHAERRHPAKGRYVTIDGVRLHYIEAGVGPAIVLIHGNAVSAEDFRASGLFDALAADHRVIAFDRPGFGYSSRPRDRSWTAAAQAEVVFKAMSLLGVEQPVAVGHSWGAMVALSMALDHPEALAGVTLISGYYTPTARVDAAVAATPAIPVLGDLMRYTVSPIVGRLITPGMLKLMFAPAPVPPGYKAQFSAGMALRPWQIRASAEDAALMVPEAARLKAALPSARTPALVIAGSGDRVVSFRRQSEWIAKALPQASLLAIEDAGHMVYHTAPGRIAEAIREFSRADARPAAEEAPLEAPAGSLAATGDRAEIAPSL